MIMCGIDAFIETVQVQSNCKITINKFLYLVLSTRYLCQRGSTRSQTLRKLIICNSQEHVLTKEEEETIVKQEQEARETYDGNMLGVSKHLKVVVGHRSVFNNWMR